MDPRLLEEGASQVTSEEDQRCQREIAQEANCQAVVQEQSPGPEQQLLREVAAVLAMVGIIQWLSAPIIG